MSKSKQSRESGTGIVISQRARLIGITWRMIIILLAVGFALFPVLFVLSSSINPDGTLSTQSLLPRGVNSFDDLTQNYDKLLFDENSLEIYPFWTWLFNSFFVAIISTSAILIITMLSAYAFPVFVFLADVACY